VTEKVACGTYNRDMLATFAAVALYGLHWSEVSIKGNHLDAVLPLIKELKYKLIGQAREVDSGKAWDFLVNQPASNKRVHKAAYFVGGWTHIADPEMVIMLEDKILARLSKSMKTPIVGWLSESTSDTYGFDYFDKGALVRRVIATPNQIESTGKRITEEGKIVWKEAGEDELLDVIKKCGPAFDVLPKGVKYRIYDLDESGM
jgi:hypothetical protein